MSSILLAAAPQNLPEGLTGAFLLLALGMGVVFAVLGGLTLVIWVIGRVFGERPAAPATEQAGAAAEPARAVEASSSAAAAGAGPTGAEAAAVAAAVELEARGGPFDSAEVAAVAAAVAQAAGARTVPAGGPFSSSELAAVAAAVAQAAGGPATVEAAAIAVAIGCHQAGFPSGAVVQVVQGVPEPGAGAWGQATFAGRGGAGLPVLRRG